MQRDSEAKGLLKWVAERERVWIMYELGVTVFTSASATQSYLE